MQNGRTPLSIATFDHDPLAPKKHHVVASTDGVNFFVLGKPGHQFVTDPIELLKLEVQGQHAIGMGDAEVRIMDENREEVARFEPYTVPHEEGPPSPERLKIRDRWLNAIFKFLLPPSLYTVKDDPTKQRALKRYFKRKGIEVQMRPDGGAVRIWREGAVMTEWGC